MFFFVCVLGLNVLLFVCTWVSMLVFFCMQSELIGNLNINCIMFFCVCSRFKDIVKSWIWTIFHNIRLRKMVDISNYGFFRALNPFPKSNWGSGEGRGVFPLFSLTSIILDLEGWLIYQTMGFRGMESILKVELIIMEEHFSPMNLIIFKYWNRCVEKVLQFSTTFNPFVTWASFSGYKINP